MSTGNAVCHVSDEVVPRSTVQHGRGAGKESGRYKVWIDIDNSPHVPFFAPVLQELRKRDIEVLLTARNMYQVCELLKLFDMPCQVVGGHWGKNRVLKVLCNCVRVAELLPVASAERPHLAVSHGSRAQLLTSKLLRIPTIMLHDYEHSTKTGFLEADWIYMPDVIPVEAMSKKTERVLRYPGLKEDVYIPSFRPDPSILETLGIKPGELLVTVRPPATEAHYHNPESEVLFADTMRHLAGQGNVRAVTLPRNGRQRKQLEHDWADLLSSGMMIMPTFPVDGLNLLWFSDLVVSGGGTMNREAAALGVPVYSIFRGKLGAVDRYLAEQGRLTLLETPQAIREQMKLAPWNRPAMPADRHIPALQWIVEHIVSTLPKDAGLRPRTLVPSDSI